MTQPYDPTILSGAPGAVPLTAMNIAPTTGERLVGYVPYGLTAIEAENGSGKSRLLSAIRAIPVPRLRPGMVTVTEGQNHASVSLGSARLEISEGGEVPEVTRHGGADGAIKTMPDPVEVLINPEVEDPDARFRARMKGLNALAPIEVTPERLKVIATGVPVEGHDILNALLRRHAEQPFRSLLEAAEFLGGRTGELNKRALEAEKTLEAHQLTSAGLGAGLREIVAAASSASGLSLDYAEARLLNNPDQLLDAVRAMTATEEALSRAEIDADRQAQEQARLDRLRASIGERPDQRLADAEVAASKAQSDRDEIAGEILALERRLAYLAQERSRLASEVSTARQAADAARAACLVWDEQQRELATPPAGPDPAEVAKLRETRLKIWGQAALGAWVDRYVAKRALVIEAQSKGEKLALIAKTLREESQATWHRLGDVVNEAMRSDIVRVRSAAVEVKMDDGRWVDVENDVVISSGYLRRFFLDFYISRLQGDVDLTVIVDEKNLLYVGEDNRREISRRAAEKRLRMVFEQPAPGQELRLRWYGGAA